MHNRPGESKIICPHCQTNIPETYGGLLMIVQAGAQQQGKSRYYIALTCYHCNNDSIWDVRDWEKFTVIWPKVINIHEPHEDMPADIKLDYEEARKIADDSPRGAAALLRLCLQKLLVEIGGPGKTIDKDIATLVKEGILPVNLQRACDTLRVLGNNAVHPDKIGLNLNDNKEIVASLFKLVNMLVQEKISNQKEIDKLYALIPENLQR